MAFRKPPKKQPKRQQQSEYECDGRISLWTPDEDKKYVISGKVQIGDEVYRVFIYETQHKKHQNSPDYFGSLFLEEEEEQEVVRTQKKRTPQNGTQKRRQQPVKPVYVAIAPEEDGEDDNYEDDGYDANYYDDNNNIAF